eukprot:6194835-Pleurochrysis_carterae.AAC.2
MGRDASVAAKSGDESRRALARAFSLPRSSSCTLSKRIQTSNISVQHGSGFVWERPALQKLPHCLRPQHSLSESSSRL